MALAKPDIAGILSQYRQGEPDKYDALVALLINGAHEDEILGDIMRQMKNQASELTKEHNGLVSAILHMKWTRLGARTVADYQTFVVNLIASNMVHLRPCIRMIVKQFLPDELSEERVVITEESMHPHRLLNSILKLVPLSPTVLLPTLREMLPSIYKPSNQHESYIQHLFHIMTYLHPHRVEILSMIMDHLTQIDVNSPKHEIEESEESDEEDEDEELFPMEGVADTKVDKDDGMKHKNGNILDILMDILFKYLHNSCHPEGKLDWEATKRVYKELLQVFDKVIIPTHDSSHVQFSMFYICSFHVQLVEGFLDYLWKKVVNPNQQAIFRRVAVSYMASLVARAQYINLGVAMAVIELITSWIHRYIRQCSDVTSHMNVTHHGPFYTVCQALFYILIYRNRELMTDPRGAKCLQSANIQTIVTSRLNPLKFCLPVVTSTFASVARQHQLAFCDTIMERNRRSEIPVEGSSRGNNNPNPLDSYFPFDPYLLKRSSQFIEPLYQEYQGRPPIEENEQDDENIEDVYYRQESTGSQKGEELMATSFPKTNLSSSVDLMEYGISPGFKHT